MFLCCYIHVSSTKYKISYKCSLNMQLEDRLDNPRNFTCIEFGFELEGMSDSYHLKPPEVSFFSPRA